MPEESSDRAACGGRDLPPAIFLMGPTGAGKTALAMSLVQRYPLSIVSVDSTMVYRGLDIGSAKPSPAEQARAPHRLIDIRDPLQPYSAAQFRDDALREMAAVSDSGRVPLLAGGTMLYFRALERGLSDLPAADPALRRELEQEAAIAGWPALHARLAQVDPEAARRIHANDPQRIQRALEVYRLSGRSMSELQRARAPAGLPYRVLKLALVPRDRTVLHAAVAQRFHAMLAAGFQGEVRGLRERGDLTADLPSMRAVGYRQMWRYLDGVISYEQMVHDTIIATRRLAKRQLTWLRADPTLCWLDPGAPDLQSCAVSLVYRHLRHGVSLER